MCGCACGHVCACMVQGLVQSISYWNILGLIPTKYGHTYLFLLYFLCGYQQQYSNIAVQYNNIAVQYSNIAVQYSNIAVQYNNIAVLYNNIAVLYNNIAVHE